MDGLTQEHIDQLIACCKVISDPPRKEMVEDRGHKRNDMRLISEDERYAFSVFMRVNSKFQENFSIGLVYLVPDERNRIDLLRCNGPHGEHANDFHADSHHVGCHVHVAKFETLEQQRFPLLYAETTKGYATYEEALRYFLKRCNITGWEKHFPLIEKLPLFDKP